MRVRLSWGEYELGAYVGFRRALVAVYKSRVDDARLARPHFGTHVDGAVAELVVAKAIGLYWHGQVMRPDRQTGDLELRGGRRIEVRHTHRENGGLPVHHADPDDHLGVLVRGRYPSFEIAGAFPIYAGKQDGYWRADLERPCFLVPALDLEPLDRYL